MDHPADGVALETFLVERYWPDVDLTKLRDALPRLHATISAIAAEGGRVEYLGSILMPVDQVVFSLMAAADETLVRQVNELADLPADRIARAIALLGTDDLVSRGDAAANAEPGPEPGLEAGHEPAHDHAARPEVAASDWVGHEPSHEPSPGGTTR
jgi:hypothetical protein